MYNRYRTNIETEVNDTVEHRKSETGFASNSDRARVEERQREFPTAKLPIKPRYVPRSRRKATNICAQYVKRSANAMLKYRFESEARKSSRVREKAIYIEQGFRKS